MIGSKPGHLSVFIFILLMIGEAYGETVVFKSIDSDGRVTYGDEPVEEAVEQEVFTFKPGTINSDDAEKRLEQMIATTKRLQEDSKERRLARQQARQNHANAVGYYPEYPTASSGYYYPYYNTRRRYPRYRPWRPRPVHYPHRPVPYSLDVGYQSSRFNGSLQVGNQRPRYGRQGSSHVRPPMKASRQLIVPTQRKAKARTAR